MYCLVPPMKVTFLIFNTVNSFKSGINRLPQRDHGVVLFALKDFTSKKLKKYFVYS